DPTPGVRAPGRRPREAALLGLRALRFVLVTGSAKAALGLGMLVALPVVGFTTLATRTAVFLYETLAQLGYASPPRQLQEPPLRNRVLNAIVVLSALLQPMLVYVPGARRLLGLERIDLLAGGWI